MMVLGNALCAAAPRFTLPHEDCGRWYVLHTKARQEKVLARALNAADSNCFLPIVREMRDYGRFKVSVETPLFHGFLFVRGDGAEQLGLAQHADRVAKVIPVHDQTRLNWELLNVCRALNEQVQFRPTDYVENETRVEVRSGPLRGLQGFVPEFGVIDRLVLQIRMLGRAVSLALNGALLAPVS